MAVKASSVKLQSVIIGHATGGLPTITFFNPTSGAVADTVTITGTNLSGTTDVQINGTSASSLSGITSTTVTATVATGSTTGIITVITPAGSANTSLLSPSVYTVSGGADAPSTFTAYATSNPGHDTPVYLANYKAYALGVNPGATMSTAAGLAGSFGTTVGSQCPASATFTNSNYGVSLNGIGAATTQNTTQFDSFPVCWEIAVGIPNCAVGFYRGAGGPSFNPAVYCGNTTQNSAFYSSDGLIHSMTTASISAPTFGPGDIIGVISGLVGSNIYFFKNGTFAGIGTISFFAAIGGLPFISRAT